MDMPLVPTPLACVHPDDLVARVRHHVRYTLVKEWEAATRADLWHAFTLAAREQLADSLLQTERHYASAGTKRLAYISIEYLLGRMLGSSLLNLRLLEPWTAALASLGLSLADLEEHEPEPAVGNGGLGRLAACFLDSLATMAMPAYGYGINYEFGLFRQVFENGWQRERPDHWMNDGYPWLIEREDDACIVPLYGTIEHGTDARGAYSPRWTGMQLLIGVPSDMPIAGYGVRTVNTLRLYAARASSEFDMAIFNAGDYIRAVERKMISETVSKVLYPSDVVRRGQELRLVQEYFLVACALRDLTRRHEAAFGTFDDFAGKAAVQLNDTHPALAVAELMRFLLDEQGWAWDRAWDTTVAVCGYTNHTLLPEALEQWPVSLMAHVLPRHLQIVFEINRRLLDDVRRRWPGDDGRVQRMSLIAEGQEPRVRMAHLALAGSHAVNGVAALHSELVKASLFPDFHAMWPERFTNKTNGVTPRRWLLRANPGLSRLVTDRIGDGWIANLEDLQLLEPAADDRATRDEFLAVKRSCKASLARLVTSATGVPADPDWLFDIQAKRIHEYKRQLLNVLHVLDLYWRIKDGEMPPAPRLHVFAGKAAPGYQRAKLVIKLVHAAADLVNHDREVSRWLRVAFLPNYRVSQAEVIVPAADLSEQISTAGTEASGTGNMKFALNGALTMGTWDGANIEIAEHVGLDNLFVFGLRVEEVQAQLRDGSYRPWFIYEHDARVRRVVDTLTSGQLAPAEPGIFAPIRDTLLSDNERYFHLADLLQYREIQQRATVEWRESHAWARKALLTVARMGWFSADRTVREYAEGIWGIRAVP
jgi:glycogen phosphorylase